MNLWNSSAEYQNLIGVEWKNSRVYLYTINYEINSMHYKRESAARLAGAWINYSPSRYLLGAAKEEPAINPAEKLGRETAPACWNFD